jgi:hypothetical protein
MCVVKPPEDYCSTFGSLPKDVSVVKRLQDPLDFIHFFTQKREELENSFPVMKTALLPNGMLWGSWPKNSLWLSTDLNENVVREIG